MLPPLPGYEPTPRRLLRMAEHFGARPAYFVRGEQAWEPTSWADFGAQVRRAACALVALGVQPGQALCILGFNRPEWVVMDHAAMMVGAVAAGIYWTSAPGEVEYILAHSQAALLLVEDAAQAAKLDGRRAALPQLQTVVGMGDAPAAGALSWAEFLALGTDAHWDEVRRRLDAIAPDDLGTLIYTSGTTGPPKAVMLTHANLTWTAAALVRAFHTDETDRFISYLPLAHVAEQVGTVHNLVWSGSVAYFARSIEAVSEHLKEVRPTFFFGVPRVWEKMQAALQQKLGELTGPKARLVAWARRVALQWHLARTEGPPAGPLLNLQMALARGLVLNKIRAAIGLDAAHLLITSAAPIAPETLRFFAGLDLFVSELYGQSEVTGPSAISGAGSTRIGSVGKALPGVQLRIADDGEILVAGPNVFKGYLGQPEATAEVRVDGWLHSGDLGRLDDQGFLFITGRKKDLLITSGGKNISPANIEADLMALGLVEHAVVVGDGRHFLSALITLKPDALHTYANEAGLLPDPAANGTWHQHPEVHAHLQREIETVNARHARVASIRKFAVLDAPLTIAQGELTPTMKIRRKAVIERHAQRVTQLYDDTGDRP